MLVGRDAELAALRALLDSGPVVTVTGAGGVGKTALALATVPGAPVCELAGIDTPEQVAAVLADALGFPSLDAALVGLADGQRLVVLDNCEHLLDAAATSVSRLIGECAGVTVLATSREPLDVPGERVLPLAPLALPVGDAPEQLRDSPAVQLLVARARDAGTEVALDAESAPAVAALCRRLDGLPLAIELAAARTRSLTPAEILTHLGQRLDLLVRRRERGPARHRSLEAAIAWSYERLPAPTRRFFDGLGVFAGRFTAESARAVAGAPEEDLLRVVEHLDQLVEQSMLTVRQRAGCSWYGLLGTLRAFARARLAERGELAAAQDRWIDVLVELAEDVQRQGTQRPALDDQWAAVHTARVDLEDAVRRCVDHDDHPDRAIALYRPLALVVYSGRAEPVAEMGEALLARWPDPELPGWADAAAVTAHALVALRRFERCAQRAEQALAAAPSAFAAVLARRTLLVHELTRDHPQQALRWADEAISGDGSVWHTEVLTLRAVALAAAGQVDEATVQAGAALDEAVALGSQTLQAWATLTHGCLRALQDPAAARAELEPLVPLCRDIGYPFVEGASCRALGAIALVSGQTTAAATWLTQALDVFVRIGHTTHLQVTLSWTAALAISAGRPAVGATLRRAAGSVRSPTSQILERAWLNALLREGGEQGWPLALRDAVRLARRELGVLATRADPSTQPESEPAATSPAPARFTLEGAVWTVSFGGRTVRLPDTKGLRDLAVLLARPGREVHCTELIGAAVQAPDTGEVLDARARRNYQSRIVELQGELTDAEDAHDRGRAEAASLELDLLGLAGK